jgi:prevent-host-death family protein
MQVNIHEAKTQLSRLIEAALRGEEVVIARGNKPVVRLEPVRSGGVTLGLLKGKVGTPPDFFAPMDEEDLRLWEGR